MDAVEGEQQSENALAALTACFERENDAILAKEVSLNETVEVHFERYEYTLPNNTVNMYAMYSKNCEGSLICYNCEQPAHVSFSEVCYTENKIEHKVRSVCLNKINTEK